MNHFLHKDLLTEDTILNARTQAGGSGIQTRLVQFQNQALNHYATNSLLSSVYHKGVQHFHLYFQSQVGKNIFLEN